MAEVPTKERRRFPRFPVALEVSMEGLPMVTASLSLHGAQVTCPTSNADLLSSYLESRSVNIELWLPSGGSMSIDSRVVYVLTRADECLIGLEFREFQGTGFQQLRSFLVRRAGLEYVERA